MNLYLRLFLFRLPLTRLSSCQILLALSLWCATARSQTVAEVSQLLAIEKQGKIEFVVAEESAAVKDSATKPMAAPHDTVMPGGSISTGANGSATIIISGAGTAQLERNTEVKLPSVPGEHSLEVLKGRLFLQINAEDLQKRQAGEFRLKTPSALLAVKGTRFFVDCEKKSDLIGLHEGSLSVTEPVSKGTASLLPGQAVNVSPGAISPPGPLSTKDKNSARSYDPLALTRTPLLLTFDSRDADGAGITRRRTPIQYFHEDRLLLTPPGNLSEWEYLRFHNFTTQYRYVNGRQVIVDNVNPLSITSKGEVIMATSYQYEPVNKRVGGKAVAAPPVFGDLPKYVHADIHFKGRAWRSAYTGRPDVGPLLGLHLRMRLKSVGRVVCSINTHNQGYYPGYSGVAMDAPAGLPQGGLWERDCVVPVTLDKSGEDSRYTLYISAYPEGPFDTAGNLRSGTLELSVIDCALVSKAH